MATLTITDRADGSGADVTVSGLSGTGTLWTSFFAGNQESQSFVNSATFAVDETQVIALANGPYFAVLIDDNGPTAPVPFRITDGTQSVHFRCVHEVRNWILAMSLPGLTSDPTKHKVHKAPKRSLTEFKDTAGDIVGVHYFPSAETRRLADNVRDEVEYPVNVVVIDSRDGDDNRLSDDWLQLRETMSKSIQECGLAAVVEIDNVRVTPGPIFPTDKSTGVDAQSMLFICHTEQVSIVS